MHNAAFHIIEALTHRAMAVIDFATGGDDCHDMAGDISYHVRLAGYSDACRFLTPQSHQGLDDPQWRTWYDWGYGDAREDQRRELIERLGGDPDGAFDRLACDCILTPYLNEPRQRVEYDYGDVPF